MKTLIFKGIATFAILATSFANAADSLSYGSRTEVGDRVVLESPFLRIGGSSYYISSAETSGICFAYGLGEKIYAEPADAQYSRYAQFDKVGKLIRIGPYGSDSPVLSLICLKR